MKGDPVIFVVDIGTTALKAALFTEDGKFFKQTERKIEFEQHRDPLYHEIDAGKWVDALEYITETFELNGYEKLHAIVVSGNGPTLIPVGPKDKPLDMAMTWMDRRGIDEADIVSGLAEVYIDPAFYLPKAFWVYRNKRDIYEKTKYFFSCPEFINYLFTGEPYTILPVPEYRPYIWTEELVTRLGMDWAKFPGFIRPGELAGHVTRNAQQRFKIPAGTPVFAGGPDFIVSLLGTATIAPGRVCDRSGTSEGINLCTGKLVEDRRLLCMSHIIEGLYNISGPVSTSGKALEWIKNITGKTGFSYEEIFKDIDEVPAGAGNLLFLPYLAGERAPLWDPHARGVFLGLSLNHGRKELMRAVAESVGFAIRDVITVMEEIGLPVHDLRITGSQAKSGIWTQMKADITGKEILVPVMKDAELTGNMSIAMFGLGRYRTLAEASEATVEIEKIYRPRRENRELYDHLFGLYRDSYAGLKNVFKNLSTKTKGGT